MISDVYQIVFKINTFQKILSGISGKQFASRSGLTFSGLIWVTLFAKLSAYTSRQSDQVLQDFKPIISYNYNCFSVKTNHFYMEIKHMKFFICHFIHMLYDTVSTTYCSVAITGQYVTHWNLKFNFYKYYEMSRHFFLISHTN